MLSDRREPAYPERVPDDLLTVRVAELYYEDGRTQDEIGAQLGITRWKVGRLLTRARQDGIVRIEIVHPRARRLPLERALRERYGLADAVVVPRSDSPEELRATVAHAAADLLTALRPVPDVLGVSWGRTLSDVADALPQGWSRGVRVVQVNGGVTLNQRAGTAAATAARIAEKAAGQAVLLPSPAILERIETKRAIEADRTVAEVLRLAASASVVLFSAGAADADSVHVSSGYLTAADVDELVRKGAVGDVLGRYLDADGNPVDPELDGRTVGVGLDALRSVPTSVFVVAGEAKHPVARAVVASGLATVIVTDEGTANALVEEQ